MVDGGSLEQQTLPTVLSHDAGGGPRACAHLRRRRLVEGGPQASSLRDGAAAVPRAPARRRPRRGYEFAIRQDRGGARPDTMISKFPSTDEIHVVVAGGTAGRFSVAIPGWLGTRNGSCPVTRSVE